jgi:PAS domain S-box-containing protein
MSEQRDNMQPPAAPGGALSAHETLRYILDYTPEAITISDPEGAIIECSAATLAVHGVASREKMLGRSIFEFFAEREHPRARRAVQKVLEQGFYRELEITCLRDDGAEFPGEISASLIRGPGGEPRALIGITKDITGRKAMNDALRESVNKYRALIETTGTGYIILDPTGMVLDANSEYLRITGYASLHQIGGRNTTEWIAPHDIGRARSALRECMETGFIRNLEIDYVNRAGSVAPVEINAKVVDTDEGLRILALCRDISERRAAELALRRSEEEFRQLFENTRDAIFWADPDTGIIINCNKSSEVLLERPRSEIIGMHQTDLHPPHLKEQYAAHFRSHVTARSALDSEAEIISASGRIVPVFISASLVDIHGRGIQQGIFRDVTELRETQREKEALVEMLYQSQKLEAIGQLAGGMAHDFNNILAVMIGNAELAMRKMTEGDPNAERVKKIIRVGRRARDLTMKLLTFARKEKLEVRTVCPNDIVREMLDMLERSISKKIAIMTELPDDAPLVSADVNQTLQALLNLCINACDAMEESGTLTVSTARVELDAAFCRSHPQLDPGVYCLIEIRDTGQGIPGEIRDKLFEPFFTTKQKGKGTGLGLSVALGVVQGHRGHLALESEPGRGTTARVYLPAAHEGASAHASGGREPAPGPDSAAVLVIDDNSDFRDTIVEMLRLQGHRVTVASSGVRGLEYYKKDPHAVDVVLLDLMMPDMDGAEVFREIRAIDAEATIVLCSGYSIEGQAGGLMAQGAAAFLQKPFEFHELQEILARVL